MSGVRGSGPARGGAAGPRGVADSEVTFVRPMTQHDANVYGTVHGGVIMHEVDTAAGVAAARHAGGVCVTAAVDELSFLAPVEVGDLLVVQARVNGVGRTSLEVGVRVEAEPWQGGPRRHTTTAFLVMVCLDGDGRPAPLPPLRAEGSEQQRRQTQAATRRQLRAERRGRLAAAAQPPPPTAAPGQAPS